MKLNNKGFSMVEILAVVVLLGILASIAIFGVSRYKTKAINDDYEALAKSSYNAMQEYVMTNPYETEATIGKLEEQRFLSNRKDPASKEVDCEGAVVYEQKAGTSGSMDEGKYTVYLCCPSYKKKYTFPDGKIENITDDTYCDVSDEPDTPEPPTPGTTYTLKYNDNGGSGCSSKSITKNANEKWGTLCTPTRSGYKFIGWTNGSNTITSNSLATSNITVKASWVSNTATTYTCSAGKYLPKNKTTCATCIAGNYCKGGTWNKSTTKDQGLTPCPSEYKNSPAGSKKNTDCYMKVAGAKYVKNKKDTTASSCGKGTYKEKHNVNYNSTSKCSNCPTGYRDGAGTTKEANCYMKVPKNNFVQKSKDSNYKACPSGQLKDPHNVYYEKISSCGAKSITVTFNCNGGTRSGPASVTYNSDVTGQKFTTECAMTGYNQDGWKRDKNGSAKNYETSSGVSENFVLTYEPEITLYAHWNIKTITCSSGYYLKKSEKSCSECTSGNYCPGGTYTYDPNDDQGIYECPSKYENSAPRSDAINDCYMRVPKDKYIRVAKDTTPTPCPAGQLKDPHNVYYGKISSCSGKAITVEFDCNGGERTEGPASSTYYSDVSGQKFTTSCTRTGYTQDGWKRDKSGTTSNYTTYSNVTENFVLTYAPEITLYAHWNIKTITCSSGYYLKKSEKSCSECTSGNYCPGGTYTYDPNDDQGIYECPTGYENSPVKSDKENDCYMHVPKNKYVKTAKAISSTVCPKGQYKDSHTVNYGKISSCESKSIEVTFNCNGGTRNSDPDSATYYSDVTGQKFTTSCTRTGYTQDGWENSINGTIYDVSSGVSENFVLGFSPTITVYAHWKPITLTVTFDCNGGTGGGTQTFTYGQEGQKFTTTCENDGFTLEGWKNNISGTTYRVTSGVTDSLINNFSPNLTVYAKWEGQYVTSCRVGGEIGGGQGGWTSLYDNPYDCNNRKYEEAVAYTWFNEPGFAYPPVQLQIIGSSGNCYKVRITESCQIAPNKDEGKCILNSEEFDYDSYYILKSCTTFNNTACPNRSCPG